MIDREKLQKALTWLGDIYQSEPGPIEQWLEVLPDINWQQIRQAFIDCPTNFNEYPSCETFAAFFFPSKKENTAPPSSARERFEALALKWELESVRLGIMEGKHVDQETHKKRIEEFWNEWDR